MVFRRKDKYTQNITIQINDNIMTPLRRIIVSLQGTGEDASLLGIIGNSSTRREDIFEEHTRICCETLLLVIQRDHAVLPLNFYTCCSSI